MMDSEKGQNLVNPANDSYGKPLTSGPVTVKLAPPTAGGGVGEMVSKSRPEKGK